MLWLTSTQAPIKEKPLPPTHSPPVCCAEFPQTLNRQNPHEGRGRRCGAGGWARPLLPARCRAPVPVISRACYRPRHNSWHSYGLAPACGGNRGHCWGCRWVAEG